MTGNSVRFGSLADVERAPRQRSSTANPDANSDCCRLLISCRRSKFEPCFLSTETFLAETALGALCSSPKSVGSTARYMENARTVLFGDAIPGLKPGRCLLRWKSEVLG